MVTQPEIFGITGKLDMKDKPQGISIRTNNQPLLIFQHFIGEKRSTVRMDIRTCNDKT
jgi:hypothetical protein